MLKSQIRHDVDWPLTLSKHSHNLLPRQVVAGVMHHLGLSKDITTFCLVSLSRMRRTLQLGTIVGNPGDFTTGLPEGDAMSVVGMLSISFVFFHKLSKLTFLANSQRDTFAANIRTLNLVNSIRRKIDFKKSWGWGNSPEMKKFWGDASCLLMDPKFTFCVKNTSQDLGCVMHYTNKSS